MKTRLNLGIYLSAALLVAGMVVGLSVLSPKIVLAASSTSETANHFGQGASQLGQSGDMGTHAASTQGGGEQTEPRFGIGNVGQSGLTPQLNCDQKVKPGQLADILTGTGGCP